MKDCSKKSFYFLNALQTFKDRFAEKICKNSYKEILLSRQTCQLNMELLWIYINPVLMQEDIVMHIFPGCINT